MSLAKPLGNFCDSCTWWIYQFSNSDTKFGLCTHPVILGTYVRITQEEFDDDKIAMFTSAYFGCNFHAGEPLVVTEIKIPKR